MFSCWAGSAARLGKSRTRSYEEKQGVKRCVTEVVGEEIMLLDTPAHSSIGYQTPDEGLGKGDSYRILDRKDKVRQAPNHGKQ